MSVSSYERYLEDLEESPWMDMGVVLGTRLSGLSPSLLADLRRYEDKRYARGGGGTLDLLEVMAACVRHAGAVTIHCSWNELAVPLTVFPQQHWVHCPLSLSDLVPDGLSQLRVLHVEPALMQPPCEENGLRMRAVDANAALAAWLWALAWHGNRTRLLPEIAGRAVYRVGPGSEWERLPMDDDLRTAVQRLRLDSVNLRDLSEWPGMDRDRAIRLLNALYLQAGLIISRSHREAFSESWWGGLGR